jgi:ABC-type proline/glycine betaine transport system ATPase subunit
MLRLREVEMESAATRHRFPSQLGGTRDRTVGAVRSADQVPRV